MPVDTEKVGIFYAPLDMETIHEGAAHIIRALIDNNSPSAAYSMASTVEALSRLICTTANFPQTEFEPDDMARQHIVMLFDAVVLTCQEYMSGRASFPPIIAEDRKDIN